MSPSQLVKQVHQFESNAQFCEQVMLASFRIKHIHLFYPNTYVSSCRMCATVQIDYVNQF